MLIQYFRGAVLWKALATPIKMANMIIDLLIKLEELKLKLDCTLDANDLYYYSETQLQKLKKKNPQPKQLYG